MRWRHAWGLALTVVLLGCGGTPTESTFNVSTQAPAIDTTTYPEPSPATSPSISPPTSSSAPQTPPTTVVGDPHGLLVFHNTAGFAHDSIEAGIQAMERIAEVEGLEMTATEDSGVFDDETLASYAAIVFLNTTGDVLNGGQEEAMERFIRQGGGFIGIHSAADTEYDWSWYGGLVGAYFSRHPRLQLAELTVTSPDHPTMEGIPTKFQRFDEWYDFRSLPAEDVNILIALDEDSYRGGRMGTPHPIVWAHEYAGGRAFYTGFGHTSESFTEDLVVTHLMNAVRWVTGRTG